MTINFKINSSRKKKILIIKIRINNYRERSRAKKRTQLAM